MLNIAGNYYEAFWESKFRVLNPGKFLTQLEISRMDDEFLKIGELLAMLYM